MLWTSQRNQTPRALNAEGKLYRTINSKNGAPPPRKKNDHVVLCDFNGYGGCISVVQSTGERIINWKYEEGNCRSNPLTILKGTHRMYRIHK